MPNTVKLYLIRHGRPSGGFADAMDPGLDEVGREQAETLATELAPLGPLPVLTSPLKRARETAAPLEALWDIEAQVESAVAEIPTPGMDLHARTAWLYRALRGRWSELPTSYQDWRQQLGATLLARETPTVITTHFVAINAAVGIATGDDRMICFEPDHCSCTVVEIVNSALRVVALGRQRATQIR
jgi:broad specificity phosphatase PhoE